MSHAVFSIVTEVIPGHQDTLEQAARAVEADHAGNGIIDFTSFPSSISPASPCSAPRPGAQPGPKLETLLVFEHNVDGRWGDRISTR